MDLDIPVMAGTVSTVMFVASTLPMLVKAVRTKDLTSYSLGNILLSNLGNLIHSVYVFSLPVGRLSQIIPGNEKTLNGADCSPNSCISQTFR